jgi:hypothetical protein
MLTELGYDLPRWGADGELGVETFEAFVQFLRDHGTEADEDAERISDAEYALLKQVHRATLDAPLGPQLATGRFHDLRILAGQKHVRGHRSWKQIRGITLHQTACRLGENPRRWAGVGAHLGVTRSGQVIWLHDVEKVVIHGNGFNASTIGIEMDGTYEGVEGDRRTFWRPKEDPRREPQNPTLELVEAAKSTIRWLCEHVKRHGGRLELLVAHRQASNQRRSDPGSALWQRVAMPLHEELRLHDGGPGHTVGSGYPIPEAWDSSRRGMKY